MKKDDYIKLNDPGQIIFEGSETAEIFTREIEESLKAVLVKNFYLDGESKGFVSASVDGRPWDGTMWSRDAGVFLRELIHFGYYGHACMMAEYAIDHCGINQQGYYSFAEHQSPDKIDSGDELDGTCAVTISLAIFLQKTESFDDPVIKNVRQKVHNFLICPESPLRLLIHEVEKNTLVAGTGEFGGGMLVDGEWCNVVQNHLVLNALCIGALALQDADGGEFSKTSLLAMKKLIHAIQTYLIGKDGFIWCVEPGIFKQSADCLTSAANVGFAGVNGCGAMMTDIPANPDFMQYWNEFGFAAAKKTFENLLNTGGRRQQFEKYGMYIQFENFCQGLLTSPSYGQGYAIQLALNLDQREYAEKLFRYYVHATYEPPKQYKLTRSNPYWFYERFLSSDYFELPMDRQTVEEGCGALNLVNVAEPLKVARLLAGLPLITSTPSAVKIAGITRIKVKNWSCVINGRLERLNMVL